MSFFGELGRRNVFRVGIAYLAAVWVLIQVADTVLPIVNAPPWILQVLVFSSALGFPLALILAWVYELTPEGIKSTSELDLGETVSFSGRTLDFAIIGLLVIALGFFIVDRNSSQQADGTQARDLRSIAALPFANESASEEDAAFFANGIHDELLTQLAKLGSLKVISRTSVEEYRDTSKNMRQIGQELGVATLLEGRVQRVGDMVRINVQLIDAETDEHIWAENYDEELTAQSIFAIQTEMAVSIAEALEATLSPRELARLNETQTHSTRAWEFYIRGKDYFGRNDRMSFAPRAVEMYESAVEEDPQFVRGWASLSHAHSIMYLYAVDRTAERLTKAQDAVERAFDLAPDSPEAHLALGYYHFIGSQDHDSALRELAIAEQAMPGEMDLYRARGLIYRRRGDWALAVANLEHALELDPRSSNLLFQLGTTHAALREYSVAEQYYDRTIELAPDDDRLLLSRARVSLIRDGDTTPVRTILEDPSKDLGSYGQQDAWTVAIYEREFEEALSYLDGVDVWRGQAMYAPKSLLAGVTYQMAGQPELAEAQFRIARAPLEAALAANPGDARYYNSLGIILAGLSEFDAAASLARQAIEQMPTAQDAQTGPAIQLEAIRVLAMARDIDTAIEQLDAYLGDEGFWSIEGLLPDPRLDPIREDPRFQVLVEKHKRN